MGGVRQRDGSGEVPGIVRLLGAIDEILSSGGGSSRTIENLRLGADYKPQEPSTRFAFPDDQGSFAKASLRCIGVGACRNGGIDQLHGQRELAVVVYAGFGDHEAARARLPRCGA